LAPIQLPKLSTRDLDHKNAAVAFGLSSAAEFFALLHEAAHIQLNHLARIPADSAIHHHFHVSELPSAQKLEELEADAWAFSVVEKSVRNRMADGAFHYLRILAMAEFLSDSYEGDQHPLAINRAHAILDKFGGDFDDNSPAAASRIVAGLEADYAIYGSSAARKNRAAAGADQTYLLSLLANDTSLEKAVWVLGRAADCVSAVVRRVGSDHAVSQRSDP
jgi:hypothetical protein